MSHHNRVPAGVSAGGQFASRTRIASSVALGPPAAVDGRTADEHRQEAAQADLAAAESFARCDTDGFLSQWAGGLTAQKHRAQARIAEQGGRSDFPALFSANGDLVPAKLLTTRYGAAWMLLDGDGPNAGCAGWFNPSRHRDPDRRRANDAVKGFYVGRVNAAADARLTSPPGARGLGGATSVSVETYRTDGGFSRDVQVLDDGVHPHPATVLADMLRSRHDVADTERALDNLRAHLMDARNAGDRNRVRSLTRQIGRVVRERDDLMATHAHRDTQLRDLELGDVADEADRAARWSQVKAHHEFPAGGFSGAMSWLRRVERSTTDHHSQQGVRG